MGACVLKDFSDPVQDTCAAPSTSTVKRWEHGGERAPRTTEEVRGIKVQDLSSTVGEYVAFVVHPDGGLSARRQLGGGVWRRRPESGGNM